MLTAWVPCLTFGDKVFGWWGIRGILGYRGGGIGVMGRILNYTFFFLLCMKLSTAERLSPDPRMNRLSPDPRVI